MAYKKVVQKGIHKGTQKWHKKNGIQKMAYKKMV
jgi:hypothetical protein